MRIAKLIALVLVAVVMAGCGGKQRMHAWGDVTFNGQPLPEGTIVFTPTDKTPGPSTGGSIKDGHYDVPAKGGPYAGEGYTVEITAIKESGKLIPNIFGKKLPPMMKLRQYIPAQYNKETTLKVTVSSSASENKFDFQLEGPSKPGTNPSDEGR